jgi:transposase
MRGHVNPQGSMFSYFSAESRVPLDHPLRTIKAYADTILKQLSGKLDALYAETGRPSIPPERLLKASLLIALYTVRTDRLFCEMLDYNILFRWFLEMDLEQPGLDQSNFSRLRERLVEHDLARVFFDSVVKQARDKGLLSDEHFTVDGTLIEAWASLKSFKRKDAAPPGQAGDGSGMVDFRGEKRTNATHESSSDPDAKLMRKGNGQEAKLSYGAHVLMDNRHGMCVDLEVRSAVDTESAAAKHMLARQVRKHVRAKTVGADKGYHNKEFVCHLREHGIAPHIAMIAETLLGWMRAPHVMPAIGSARTNASVSRRSSVG